MHFTKRIDLCSVNFGDGDRGWFGLCLWSILLLLLVLLLLFGCSSLVTFSCNSFFFVFFDVCVVESVGDFIDGFGCDCCHCF
ncbi:hypothetical protein K501DRAFT_76617 [Backusella circina FSU 941]|nr:hypothetical protein K501DRAFT_76617 [Backusella circina FSU 941]